jgi:hypothetical protein
MVEVSSHYDMIRGEFGLGYSTPKWSPIVGGALSINVDYS